MEILLLVILIVLNGVFAMSELAVVASRQARLNAAAEKGSSGATKALELQREPTRFLSTVQIGITTISILNGVVGAAALAGPMTNWLSTFGLEPAIAGSIATVLAVVVITYASIVIGELVPKRIAQVAPERIAAMVAPPMAMLAKISAPFVWLLTVSTKLILKVLGVSGQVGEPITEEEIEAMLSEGSAAGVIKDSEHEMVRNVFSLDDRRIGTFMTPRSEMIVLNINDDLQKNLAKVASSRRSRFPISDGNNDNIIGVVQTKALVQALIKQDRPNLTKQVEKPLFVPESLTGRELLEAMRADKSTAALVVDEYGDLQGLVTVNDLMNTIAGGIEYPQAKPQANQRNDGSWLLDGKLSTVELRHILKLKELPDESPGHYDSLGGLMMTLLDRVPTVGEEARWGGWIFEVMDLDGRRIDKVLARKDTTGSSE